MEKNVADAKALLQQKQTLFLEYFDATEGIIGETNESALEKYITRRDSLANEIDKLDAQILILLEQWQEQLPGLLGARTPQDALPQELQPLYEVCASLRETMRRTRLKNNEALAHVQSLRDDAERQIKNSSNMPKINRYLTNLSGGQDGNNFGTV